MLKMRLIHLLLALTLGLAIPAPVWAAYTVGYGDAISVTVKDSPQYNFAGPIRPDGYISIPFVGEIDVRGLSTDDVRDRVKQALTGSLRNPEVSVTVTGFKTRTVFLFGEVTRPGPVELSRSNLTVLDVISQVGGFTDRAVQSELTLYRGTGALGRRYSINAEYMLKTGDFKDNLLVQDGDRIQVPSVWYPDLRAMSGNFAAAMSLITTVMVVLNFYDRVAPR